MARHNSNITIINGAENAGSNIENSGNQTSMGNKGYSLEIVNNGMTSAN